MTFVKPSAYWMVVTLKSGTQLKTLVTEYVVRWDTITGQLCELEWATHPASPIRLRKIDLSEVAAVHSDFTHLQHAGPGVLSGQVVKHGGLAENCSMPGCRSDLSVD